MKTFQLVLLFLFFIGINLQSSFAQCESCTITFSGNGNPTPNRNIEDEDVICITGDRSSRINLRNRDDLTICIASGVTYSNDFNGSNGDDLAINNYGQFGIQGTNRNLQIGGSHVLNNFGSIFFRSLTNEGTVNSSSGTIAVERDLENDEGILNLGQTTVGGDFVNNNLVTLAGSLIIENDLDNDDRDATIRPLDTNQCNTISVGGDLENRNGTITGNDLSGPYKSPLLVNKSPDDGNLTGGAIIDPSLDCSDKSGPPSGNCWRYIDDGTESGIVIIEFFDNCNWDAPAKLAEFEVLVLGGGGGGGSNIGGGGGSGGLVHARALVTEVFPDGLPANSSFNIKIGQGGEGSDDEDDKGGNGTASTFDLGGIYEIKAAGGGGGGSSESRRGNNGSNSSYKNSTRGFSTVSNRIFGSSGGGAGNDGKNADRGLGGNNGRNGGRGNDDAAGGGGGISQEGQNARDEEGGNGGAGLSLSEFDSRTYGAGGGGSGEDERGFGGANLRGGNGAEDNENGEDGQTPGSGGGGGGDNRRGGKGAKGVVLIRYEIARILPVEFLSFRTSYRHANRSSLLEWTTGKEWENSHFEIERAVNSIASWAKIGEVQGQGFSQTLTSYKFEDDQIPNQSGNIFYRIKQVDFNGNFTYSNTTAIQVEPQKSSKLWRAYPNPTNGQSFQVSIADPASYQDEPISIRLISSTGLYQFFNVDTPETIGLQVSEWLSEQDNGIYTLEIAWGPHREYHKLILQR
ncbi:glycine-rich domain-containing protein [Algoriphagus namhaensis]